MSSDQQNIKIKDEPGVRIDLPRPFTDDRGAIQPLVSGDFKAAQLITSKAGTVRANHYHKEDSHYMYIVSGEFDYYYRSTGSSAEPRCLRLKAGEMVYTPPMFDHAVKFVKNTTFINFTSCDRDQSTYEDDIVRISLIASE
ncbi:MAG: hypothetical protein OEN02_00730 [Gammaproteobacteria bacterium]|nr:hypothetical protein [Gammaproteobacteria bacterium]MDH3535431.1 hypothetical protein [Gammaproteobacteria bacterium]